MGAVGTKTLADLRRRRLQAVVIGAVLFLASAASTLGLAVLVESQAPFDHAFAQANGAHIVITYDGGLTAGQLDATAHAPGVTETAGPWPTTAASVTLSHGGDTSIRIGQVSARPSPDTTVDRMTLTAGRWWQSPGEVVVSAAFAQQVGVSVGDTIGVAQATPSGDGFAIGAPGKPGPGGPPPGPPPATKNLTVVGIAGSISTPGVLAWMSPADLAALSVGHAPTQQMLYRVAPAATAAELAAATTAITAGVPADAVVGTQTYLAEQGDVNRTAAIFIPILLAFALFALLAAAFIITNVVSGVILASYREIGVMRAIGYTPGQVATILLGEILVPVTVGTIAGIAVGTLGSQPLLAQTAQAFGLASVFTLSGPVVLAVVAAAIGAATIAAVGPAVRAGRLSAVGAITQGTTPSARAGGGIARRAALGLPLPTAIRLGMGSGLTHALRAAMTLGALVTGVAALVFALGLNGSLRLVAGDFDRDQASPIRATLEDPSVSPGAVSTTIAANPATDRWVSVAQGQVTIPQLGGPIPFVGYGNDSAWIGYALVDGRWFSGRGEAVAPTNFFTQSGLHVGDTVTGTSGGRSFTVRLVGEIFDQAEENRDDLVLRGELSDLLAVDPTVQPSNWEILPKAGTNLGAYRSALQDATNNAVSVEVVASSATDTGFLLYEGVIGTLGLVLIVISLGGVFNTVLLETRQRARETAILKSIGMTPAQTLIMVVASIVPVALVAGVIGVPLGIAFQHVVLTFMGQAADRTAIPASVFDTFPPIALLALGLSGLAIGALGAYLPAQQAARARIATVLQAE